VRASHILIGTQGMKTDEEKAEAKKKAEKVLAEVKKPGSDFGPWRKSIQPVRRRNEGATWAPSRGTVRWWSLSRRRHSPQDG